MLLDVFPLKKQQHPDKTQKINNKMEKYYFWSIAWNG